MNVDRIRALAAYLRQPLPPTRQFDMLLYGYSKYDFSNGYSDEHPCGTAGCIAGHAVMLFGAVPDEALLPQTSPDDPRSGIERLVAAGCKNNNLGVFGMACDLLGIDLADTSGGVSSNYRLAERLFVPDVPYSFGEITPAVAADVLDNLADTGTVVWPDKIDG
jgi:hypothetical protein